jgi:hypothetical protein
MVYYCSPYRITYSYILFLNLEIKLCRFSIEKLDFPKKLIFQTHFFKFFCSKNGLFMFPVSNYLSLHTFFKFKNKTLPFSRIKSWKNRFLKKYPKMRFSKQLPEKKLMVSQWIPTNLPCYVTWGIIFFVKNFWDRAFSRKSQ